MPGRDAGFDAQIGSSLISDGRVREVGQEGVQVVRIDPLTGELLVWEGHLDEPWIGQHVGEGVAFWATRTLTVSSIVPTDAKNVIRVSVPGSRPRRWMRSTDCKYWPALNVRST